MASWVPSETQRLFADQVPSVPSSTVPAVGGSSARLPAAAPLAPPASASTSAPSGAAAAAFSAPNMAPHSAMTSFGPLDDNTLDEPVLETLKRDLFTIGRNLRNVLIPVNWDFENTGALHNWDLWGPLVFMLVLAITLSVGEQKPSDVFALVFTEVALGALVLTVNTILLGGNIVFFQSLCLMGYCLFPMCIAAIVCVFVSIMWVRTLVLALCLAWASFATVPFVRKTVPEARKALAVFPVLLLYGSIGWLALVKS